jgi:hypothetical protein
LPQEHRPQVDTGDTQGVERAVVGLDAKLRCTSTSRLNNVANHTRPGATRCRMLSASRAKANITIVKAANGRTWFVTTRLRRSMRRSLPATSRATRQRVTGGPPSPGRRRRRRSAWRASRPAPARGWRRRPWRRRRPPGGGCIELVATGGVEPGVGFVEQPQLGPAGDDAGERGPALLPGRQPSNGTPARRPSSPIRASAASISPWVAPTVAPQKRTFSATVRSPYRPLPCPSSPTRGRIAAWSVRRSRSSTRPSPRAMGSRPAHSRSSDVLPAPFGPWSSTISPRRPSR